MLSRKQLFISIILVSGIIISAQTISKKTIYLSWKDVIGISKTENLSLKSKMLEYNFQNLEVWKSLSSFLPTFSYQGIATNNLELPVFVFMGQRFVVGTKFSFQHGLDLSLPLFNGGLRWFNYNMQNSIEKSLKEELNGKEEEVVLQTLTAYYGIMLTNSIYSTAKEAVKVAAKNLEQVEKFYSAGTATELDLQRAKAQYASTLPAMEKANSDRILSAQRLKYLLSIPFEDSLIVLDSLSKNNFLNEYNDFSLDEFKSLSAENRSDIISLKYRLKATEYGEYMALGKFAPTVLISANVMHQAQLENSTVRWDDYIRSKSISLIMIWPIFEGGRKILEYQQAKIQTDQMKILFKQVDNQRVLEVEENFYNYFVAAQNMTSLYETLQQARESLRLSNLLYSEGMSTQLDVLNAQLFYSGSSNNYYTGIYNYNTSQLNLLNSIGLLEKIWE